MLLAPSGSDFRVADADSIPVVDGKFAFDLYVDEVMPYALVSMEEFNNGAWYICVYTKEQSNSHIFRDGLQSQDTVEVHDHSKNLIAKI